MKTAALAGLGLLQILPSTAEYVWPSQYDYLEDLRYLQSGYIREGFVDGVNPCDFSSAGAGRQTAAEWVRTAYHDMSTHDAAAGTGGLDASIMFETERDENVGDAFNGTFGFTNNYHTIRASTADLIALSTVVAVGRCGGPKIPFRVGRIDATEAGPLGVPKPDQDIDTHTQIFAKAGFNTSDMIAMVACGHTLGGVHGKNFPEITLNSSDTNFEHFEADDSFSLFDNAVVTEYLDDSTDNLLVHGPNATLNSDARVFAADNNATMRALSDAATFQSSCASILGRMIDAVPAGVALSDTFATDPIPIKPYITSLALLNATHISFTGRIRVYLTPAGTQPDAHTVSLTYLPARDVDTNTNGTALNTTISTVRATYRLGTSVGLFGETFTWHEFSTTIPAASGIAGFNVTVVDRASGAATVYDNAGSATGYPLDDSFMYLAKRSCSAVPAGDDANTSVRRDVTVRAAVRKDVLAEDGSVAVDVVKKVARVGVAVPKLEVERWEESEAGKASREEVGDWVVFEVTGRVEGDGLSTTFDILSGEKKIEYQRTGALLDQPCSALAAA
ncbi:wsc domain-containing protein [Diplodia corticola]|uniref:Peroxidase n=1 Tax=Diplodia corticola TaxID=236234 RepID=A0A1J9QUV2_9PEZI|nr:wsc domain-containing protein [Diplodia corticola]OJD32177.1 wsc domain-containing protein [Diplodia corticola]